MDRILPIDLERAQLRKSLSGYARKEVDALIKGASETMQQLLVENDRLRGELDQARAELGRTRTQEDTLKETLLMAQKAADETRAAAHRTAEVLLEEARNASFAERISLEKQLTDLQWDLEKLKNERDRFRDDFRATLERYHRGLVADALEVVVAEPVAAAEA